MVYSALISSLPVLKCAWRGVIRRFRAYQKLFAQLEVNFYNIARNTWFRQGRPPESGKHLNIFEKISVRGKRTTKNFGYDKFFGREIA